MNVIVLRHWLQILSPLVSTLAHCRSLMPPSVTVPDENLPATSLLVRAHSDGRVNVHGRTTFHGVEVHVMFTSFPAVKPFPAGLTLLGKVTQRERNLFGSIAHALSS